MTKFKNEEVIETLSISAVFKEKFLDYAGYVIKDRAVPSMDGFKPVARRILYTMYTNGYYNNKAYVKSARIVGDTMGRYHPHGDSSIYKAMALMSTSYNNNVPLVDGHGAMGSIDGGEPAAMRYCHTGDTYVHTSEGIKFIKDIYDKYDKGSNSSEVDIIKGNLKVKSIDGQINDVIKIFNCGKHQIIKITLKNGLELKGTPNHPVLTLTDKLTYQWKELQNITLEDEVVIDFSKNDNLFRFNEKITFDIEEARFLGAMVSEGYVSGDNRVGINNYDVNMVKAVTDYILHDKWNLFDTKYLKLIESNEWEHALLKLLKVTLRRNGKSIDNVPNSALGLNIKTLEKEDIKSYNVLKETHSIDGFINIDVVRRNMNGVIRKLLNKNILNPSVNVRLKSDEKIEYYYDVSSNELYDRLINEYNFGRYSNERSIPEKVFISHDIYKCEFLKYMYEGDGSISLLTSNNKLSISLDYTTNSPKLKSGLLILLGNMGIEYRVSIDNRVVDTPVYRITISGLRDLTIFRDKIGFISNRKMDKLNEAVRLLALSTVKHDNGSLYKSDSIRTFINNNIGTEYTNNEKFCRRFRSYSNSLFVKNSLYLYSENMNVYNFLSNFYDKYRVVKVRDIEKLEDEIVYSFKVDSDCHSYITNGIFSHNTEARLEKFTEDIVLSEIRDKSVDYVPNYDGSTTEPVLLPVKVPILLLNGISGISTGFTTDIPSHNLGEVLDACIAYVSNRNLTKKELLEYIPAPDFPTGGSINGYNGIPLMYQTGVGGYRVRGSAVINKIDKTDEHMIVINEIPPSVQPSKLVEQIISLHNTEVIKVKDVIDAGDLKTPVRIEVTVHKSEDPERVLNVIFAKTELEKGFKCNLFILVDKKPCLLSLLEIIREFVNFRENTLERKHKNEKQKNDDRLHILDGMMMVYPKMDAVIDRIRKSESTEAARNGLMKEFKLSYVQADYILNQRLLKLTKFEIDATKKEIDDLKRRNKILASLLQNNGKNANVDKLMTDEWTEIKKKHATPRKTKIIKEVEHVSLERLIKAEPCAIIVTKKGYVKRLQLKQSDMIQNRGGKGLNVPGMDEDDEVANMISCNTNDELVLITSIGKAYNKLAFEIDETKGLGKPIKTIFNLNKKEKPIIFTRFADDIKEVVLVQENGDVKKSNINDFRNIRNNGKKIMNLSDDGEQSTRNDKDLVAAVGIPGTSKNKVINYVIIASMKGKALKLDTNSIRTSSSNAGGIKGLTLEGDDVVVSACLANSDTIAILSTSGFVKKVETNSIRSTNRGGKGVNISNKADDGDIIYVGSVNEGLLTLSTSGNKMLTLDLNNIREMGKSSKGVKAVKLDKGEVIVSAF
ncbi:MAG: DNA gyrase subunit A [Peptostreptococcaceae bacterium]